MKLPLILFLLLACSSGKSQWQSVDPNEKPDRRDYVSTGCRMDPGFSPTICAAQEKRFQEALKDWQAKHSPYVVDTTIVPPPSMPDISDNVIIADSDGNLYLAPLDSLHRPISDTKRWRKISPIPDTHPSMIPPIAGAMPDAWNGTDTDGRRGWFVKPSSTPRLDALEKQVQYLLRRVTELELEIKQGKGDTGIRYDIKDYGAFHWLRTSAACIHYDPKLFAWPLKDWRYFNRLFEFRHCKVGGTWQGLFDLKLPADITINSIKL
jgi:hypothetical protein